MAANRLLSVPPFNRYNQAMEKAQLSIVCSKRISAQQLAASVQPNQIRN